MKTFLLLLSLLFNLPLQAQVYISNKQEIMDLKVSNIPDNQGKKIITIKGDSYKIELPDNSVLSGKLKFEKDFTNEYGQTYRHYKLDIGGKLVIGADDITVTLDGHDRYYTYYLKDNLNKQIEYYFSNRQSIIDFDKYNIPDNHGKREISIRGSNYKIELPDNTVLSGALTFDKEYTGDEGKKYKRYNLNNEGSLIIGEHIVVYLKKTHNKVFTYYLNEELKKETVKRELTEKEKLYKFQEELRTNVINTLKHNYDPFTQVCLEERKVRIGMDGKAVSLLLDDKIRVQTTQTANGTTEIQTYKNYIIHVTNGKVDAISEIR